jgi:iron complex transport system ATP-binding protein
MEGDPLIEAQEVSVVINSKLLLDGVSLLLQPGRVIGVVGSNGAGKSTLRKVLAGDTKPAVGRVIMDGKPLEEWPVRERARVRAVLPQDSSLTFPFTSLEVALMGRSPHLIGGEGPRDYKIARAALEAAEVLNLETRLYPTLSGGERQRVQLARVLAQVWEQQNGASRYLLLDEPTSNLDLTHQHSTLGVARHFAGDGVGVLVILHDLNLAAQYCDEIIMLKQGRRICSGPPSEVFTTENIHSTFGVETLVMQHPTHRCPLIVTT